MLVPPESALLTHADNGSMAEEPYEASRLSRTNGSIQIRQMDELQATSSSVWPKMQVTDPYTNFAAVEDAAYSLVKISSTTSSVGRQQFLSHHRPHVLTEDWFC